MTTQERVQTITEYGFTERQARFLVLVMRHSGLCVKRQYAAFAGIKPGGEKCQVLFDKLMRRGYAMTSECIHNRARLYHVHHKPLYHAIGEPESRYRRAVPARAVMDRLMRLDTALLSPDLDWLTTRAEKRAYATSKVAGTSEGAVDGSASTQVEVGPGTFPIGLDADGRLVLIYVARVPWTDDFRAFLDGHLPLLSVVERWTVRVTFPLALQRVMDDYTRACHEQLESRLDAAALMDLQWYFFHCRRGTDWSTYASGEAIKAKVARCLRLFTGPRFTRLYHRWLKEGEDALRPVPLAVSEALASGRAALDLRLLPHAYDHLSPLVSGRRAQRHRDTADAEEGDMRSRGLHPLPSPGSCTPSDDRSGRAPTFHTVRSTPRSRRLAARRFARAGE
jgi:hypothetical protein